MELSTSHGLQLFAALLFGLIAFAGAYAMAPRKILALIVVIIPFQLVASRYGSLNMVLVYLVFLAFMTRSTIKSTPFLMATCFVFLAYVLSILGAPRATWFDHVLYLISVLSNFLLFYITYNVFIRYPDLRLALRLLIVMDILCVAYALILYFVGFDKLAFLGVQEWTLHQNLEGQQRLMGAFNAVGVTAAFYASQILFLIYAAFYTERGWMRYLCYGLAVVNFSLIVASGSRGSFLSMLGGLMLLLYFLGPTLGILRTTRITLIGATCFAALSLYVVTQTEFNVLFERLGETELSASGVPDTRQLGFDLTLERLDEALFIGHGPRIKLIDEETRIIPDYKPLGFHPHNLTLFLIYSVGILGLTAYIVYFSQLFFHLLRSKRNRHHSKAIRYIPLLGLVFMIMFFIDQLKIEYLRFMFADYQQYIFYILGMLLAFSKIARTQQPARADNKEFKND